MIEKFSKEEINQLLRELGLSQKTIIPKKSIALAEQKARIAKVFKNEFYPNTRETKPNGVPIALSKRNVQKNVFDSIVAIVDYTLGNFELGKERFGNTEYIRSTTVSDNDLSQYKAMFDEIVDIIEKYYN